MPPTEKKGRVHTSTVTVAVIDKCATPQSKYSKQNKVDFTIEWFSGTGAGGQHRNKHQNSCRIIHIPTGLKQEAQCRSRQNSYQEAMSSMIKRLGELSQSEQTGIISKDRREKVGTGMRGDKIRTYRFQDNIVKDHNTNKMAPCDRVMRGYFELLW